MINLSCLTPLKDLDALSLQTAEEADSLDFTGYTDFPLQPPSAAPATTPAAPLDMTTWLDVCPLLQAIQRGEYHPTQEAFDHYADLHLSGRFTAMRRLGEHY